MPEWIGKTVGKVRIEKAIAKGGMAEVYLGTHLTLDRPVAVKVMHNFMEADPELQSRFEREAKVVAGLRHPNIVHIFDYDTADGHPYIVMEYLQGVSLASFLRELHKRNQRLQPAQVARLLVTVAGALDYAHEKGVVHRDVKPGNIILHTKTSDLSMDQPITEQAEPVLTDFGLVRIAQAAAQTASGAISGTPAYMSPEQAQGLRVDHRSDIYSLGVVLYEMVAGRIPFEADTSWTLIFKHINEPPPVIAGVQPAVQTVIERALAKNPDLRYQSARALAADYIDAIGLGAEASTLRMSLPASLVRQTGPQGSATGSASQPANQAAPVPVPVTTEPTPGSQWPRIAAFSSVAILAVVLGGFLFSRFSPSLQPTPIPTRVNEATQGPTEEHATEHLTSDANVAAPLEAADPVGLLRFQDGTVPADALTISTESMPLPPDGSRYEAWLIEDDAEQRISIGTLSFGPENKGSLIYVDGAGRNLIGQYSAVEITIEPDPDSNPNSSNNVAFSVRLPESGLTHVRHLLSSFNATPHHIGLTHGLNANTELLTELAAQMLTAFETGNDADVLLQAERMLSVVVGNKSPDYRDWDANGAIEDPGDGFGLLQNEDQVGYIQGTYTHADLVLTSTDATENMLTHGEHVKASALNVSDWTAQLRTQLLAILENPSNPDREATIRQAVALANQIRTGLDVNGNENIEPIPGEGGAVTAYEHAYYMADTLILPVDNQTPTP
ncbi:MAG TPA: protein kinase [Anaerolineales bacterium]|nr:protein kinase [Anaerolineales bacterium]